ncbi:MAG: prepilin-type N-terminal cleavage/methylation domain-containing protein [Deltaproteobacteria bacterium]
MKDNRTKGFTLIELMIVVAIIGILAAIAIPNYLDYKTKSYNIIAKTDIANARKTATIYFSVNDDKYLLDHNGKGILKDYGFVKSDEVNIMATGHIKDLFIQSYHLRGSKVYEIQNGVDIVESDIPESWKNNSAYTNPW